MEEKSIMVVKKEMKTQTVLTDMVMFTFNGVNLCSLLVMESDVVLGETEHVVIV